MELHSTLERYALQLKNTPRTLLSVAGVVQKIMKLLYDTHFPNAEARRPGRNPDAPDSDILTLAWLLEYIGADSEHAGYRRLKTELSPLFAVLPERSRFNRRRRNLLGASEVIRKTLRQYLPQTDVFIVAPFPIPMCNVKRGPASTFALKWADGSGCLATYGHCATSRSIGDRKHVFSSDAAKQSEATISGGFSQTAGGVAASD